MKKILIIEDEFASIKNAIDTLIVLQEDGLIYELVSSSQEIHWEELDSFSAIFVDIVISDHSQLDGFGILKKIKESYSHILPRVAIITANSILNEFLPNNGICEEEFVVFYKPLKYMDLYNFINK